VKKISKFAETQKVLEGVKHDPLVDRGWSSTPRKPLGLKPLLLHSSIETFKKIKVVNFERPRTKMSCLKARRNMKRGQKWPLGSPSVKGAGHSMRVSLWPRSMFGLLYSFFFNFLFKIRHYSFSFHPPSTVARISPNQLYIRIGIQEKICFGALEQKSSPELYEARLALLPSACNSAVDTLMLVDPCFNVAGLSVFFLMCAFYWYGRFCLWS